MGTGTLPFSTDEDVIGYTGRTIRSTRTHTKWPAAACTSVQDSDGNFLKLQFIDPYDDQGQRGSPKFELEQLMP